MMYVSRFIWVVAILLVISRGPAGAAGRTLDTTAADGLEPGATIATGPSGVPQTAAVEVQTTPLLQAAAPANSRTTYRVSSRKGPTVSPPPTSATKRAFKRILKQLPADSTLMTAGDLESQFKGAKRPQVFRGSSKGFKPQANGVGGIPYSDSRFTADYVTLAQSRVGALFVVRGGWIYLCSASVINRALLVTAAHCVCDWGMGQNCFPDTDAEGNLQVYFDLGRDVASGPGWWQPANWWSAAGILVPSAYAYGTDTTTSGGPVPTSNDLALIWLKPMNESDIQVGDLGGWFSYAVNGWGFSAPSAAMGLGAPTAPASSQVTVLGYPLAFDLADRMQISNSAAYFMQLTVKRNPRGVKNLIRGTSFTGGSSGGAWVANYGIDADIISDDSGPMGQYGPFNAERNVVLGVISWGYEDVTSPKAPQLEGASMFGTNKEFPASTYGTRGPGNIGALMYDACDNPALPEWQLKSKGLCE